MSSKRASARFVSSSLRLSLLYAILLGAAFALTALIVWRTATVMAESDLRQRIILEVDAIGHELDVEGLEAAAAAIASRAERPGAPEYWLTDQTGKRLVGDLSSLEGPNGWRTVTLNGAMAGGEGREDLLVLTRTFPGGARLSVGEDPASARRTIGQTIAILGAVGIVSVLLVLVAGYLVTRSSLKRLDDVKEVLNRVSAGDLSARTSIRPHILIADVDYIGDGINQMLDRNQRLVEGLRQVSRDIAHDLRTPLSHLRQRLERARSSVGISKDQEIDAAEEKAAQIIKTFDAILRLADIEAGSAKARFTHVELGEIVDTVVDAYNPDIEQGGRSVHVECEQRAIVWGDCELLTQAVANLIENALRHTAVGTEISVTVRNSSHPILGVADNGPGIPLMQLQHVKRPFVRADSSRGGSGVGLGLSITNAIAELHSATFELRNLNPGLLAQIAFPAQSG